MSGPVLHGVKSTNNPYATASNSIASAGDLYSKFIRNKQRDEELAQRERQVVINEGLYSQKVEDRDFLLNYNPEWGKDGLGISVEGLERIAEHDKALREEGQRRAAETGVPFDEAAHVAMMDNIRRQAVSKEAKQAAITRSLGPRVDGQLLAAYVAGTTSGDRSIESGLEAQKAMVKSAQDQQAEHDKTLLEIGKLGNAQKIAVIQALGKVSNFSASGSKSGSGSGLKITNQNQFADPKELVDFQQTLSELADATGIGPFKDSTIAMNVARAWDDVNSEIRTANAIRRSEGQKEEPEIPFNAFYSKVILQGLDRGLAVGIEDALKTPEGAKAWIKSEFSDLSSRTDPSYTNLNTLMSQIQGSGGGSDFDLSALAAALGKPKAVYTPASKRTIERDFVDSLFKYYNKSDLPAPVATTPVAAAQENPQITGQITVQQSALDAQKEELRKKIEASQEEQEEAEVETEVVAPQEEQEVADAELSHLVTVNGKEVVLPTFLDQRGAREFNSALEKFRRVVPDADKVLEGAVARRRQGDRSIPNQASEIGIRGLPNPKDKTLGVRYKNPGRDTPSFNHIYPDLDILADVILMGESEPAANKVMLDEQRKVLNNFLKKADSSMYGWEKEKLDNHLNTLSSKDSTPFAIANAKGGLSALYAKYPHLLDTAPIRMPLREGVLPPQSILEARNATRKHGSGTYNMVYLSNDKPYTFTAPEQKEEAVPVRSGLVALSDPVGIGRQEMGAIDAEIAAIEAEKRRSEALNKPERELLSTSESEIKRKLSSAPITGKKGSLPAPAKVLSVSNTPAGAEIVTSPGSKVSSIHPGKVMFIGSLRGYGQAVMVDHGSGQIGVYAGSGEVQVNKNDWIDVGQEVLTLFPDSSTFLFDITDPSKSSYAKGTRGNYNPLSWIKSEALP